MSGPVTPVTVNLSRGDTRPALLAVPPGESTGLPGVVIIHDITGVRADTHRHCRRFAEAGYVALAPDLYNNNAPGCVVKIMTSMATEQGEAFAIIEAARSTLAAHPRVDPTKIAVTGFCMGGGFALLAAADGEYAVAAPFYGMVTRDRERLRTLCPTLAQYGDQDLMMRPHVRRLRSHFSALDGPHQLVVHRNAAHSFMNDHPGFGRAIDWTIGLWYDEATEADAWRRLLAFFDTHLSTAPAAPVPPHQ